MSVGTRTILHVDMDAFYCSVEQRDNPELRGKPLIVGGPLRRGVVAAASYEIRPFGVHSAMSMSEAMRLCPHAIVVPPKMSRYAAVSDQVFAIFRRYTPLVEGLSLDEAFLDVTASRSLYGDGTTIANRIRNDIQAELALTASAGIAPSKFIAKLASDHRKPNGFFTVEPHEVEAFLRPLPIKRMWGIGAKTLPRAEAFGFHTFADLADAPLSKLEAAFGNSGAHLAALARGEDDREVIPERDAKSVGAEETFDVDLRGKDRITPHLLAQSERIALRLQSEHIVARTVTVKIKYADFVLNTRAMKLTQAANDTDSIFVAAKRLLNKFDLKKGVRLTGVSASDLEPEENARELFVDPRRERSSKLDDVTSKLRERFGDKALVRAEILDRGDRSPIPNVAAGRVARGPEPINTMKRLRGADRVSPDTSVSPARPTRGKYPASTR